MTASPDPPAAPPPDDDGLPLPFIHLALDGREGNVYRLAERRTRSEFGPTGGPRKKGQPGVVYWRWDVGVRWRDGDPDVEAYREQALRFRAALRRSSGEADQRAADEHDPPPDDGLAWVEHDGLAWIGGVDWFGGEHDLDLVRWVRNGGILTAAEETIARALEARLADIRGRGFRALGKRYPIEPGLVDRLVVSPDTRKPPPGAFRGTAVRRRKSTRKTVLPHSPDGLYQMANLRNHGTRNLGQVGLGVPDWRLRPDGAALVGHVNNVPVGMIEFDDGDLSPDQARRLVEALGPRTLKTMIGVSKLIYELARGKPLYAPHTVTLRLIALAAGLRPDKHRGFAPETLEAIAADLKACTKILTYGAPDAPDKKTGRTASGWIAPLLTIPAIKARPSDPLEGEFDVLLGKNWAAAMLARFDVVQIPPGLLQLHSNNDAQVLKLGWYYTTLFRERMTRGPGRPPTVRGVARAACLDVDEDHMSRWLVRFTGWHARLVQLGVIGSYTITPPDGNPAPGEVFAQATVAVTAPEAIALVYDGPRRRAQERRAPRRRRRA